jgi:hypothetical protein
MKARSKVTYLAVIRNILAMERDSRETAKKCAKSRNKFDRTQMVKAYNADADDYKKLAELVRAEKWKEAFKFWWSLDTFVREGIPTAHAEWIAKKIR